MERAVFWIAIVVAGFAGLAALADHGGGGHWTFHDGDGFGFDPVMEASAANVAQRSYQAGDIEVRHAAVRITVIPEDRQDVAVELVNPGRVPTPEITLEGGQLIIDGRLRGRVGDCLADGGAEVRGYGDLALTDLPHITIRTPMTLNLDVGTAGVTEIGAATQVTYSQAGCGSATIADVSGALDIDVAGSGKIEAGTAGQLKLDLAGSGSLVMASVNGADIDLAGSGSATIGAINGTLDNDMGGSGQVRVRGGDLTNANISLGGSGMFELESGNVGEAQVEIGGSGHVRIGGPVRRLDVEMAGSGDVVVDGVVGDIDAEIAGSGQVRVQSMTGTLRQEIFGSGRVQVGT